MAGRRRTVYGAYKTGKKELVLAMMENLAKALDDCANDNARSPMVRQLRELRAELDEIEAAEQAARDSQAHGIAGAAQQEDAAWE